MTPTEASLRENLDIEDSEMTFQVGLVGSDGLIVGSDRKVTHMPPNSTSGYAQFDNQRKFETSTDEAIICAWSGTHSQGQRMAREIVGLDPHLSDIAWVRTLDKLSQPTIHGVTQLIVVRKHRPGHIVWINRGGSEGSAARVETHICAGKKLYASFLPGNFLEEKRTVDELRNLALLTLDYGASEAPTNVGGGYDLMILRSAGKVEWEHYGEHDGRVCALRGEYEQAARKILYPESQR
jgi:hypothetical protein